MSSKENADYLMQQAQAAGITDRKELANFMGQMQVESGGFKSMEESLNYSGMRLLEVFPGRNGIDDLNKANEIAKGGPESIANAIYGGKWGRDNLGNTEPGDGWKYHGRGYIQLTGRDGYAAAGAKLGLDLINNPDLAANRENAADIAKWYWESRVVSKSHQDNVDKATHDINRGNQGLVDRRTAAAEREQKLERGYLPGAPEPTAVHTLKQGMRGAGVKHVQEELHGLGYLQTGPNGRFGPATKAAVESFQHAQGLTPDGKAGPATQRHLDKAIHDKQMTPAVAAVSDLPLMFSDPSHPQNALYNTLKAGFPADTTSEWLSHATATCYMSGIRQPDDLGNVFGNGEKIMFMSNSLLAQSAMIDTTQPPPSVQQTMQHVQQFDQQQAQMMGQIHAQNAQVNAQTQQGGMR